MCGQGFLKCGIAGLQVRGWTLGAFRLLPLFWLALTASFWNQSEIGAAVALRMTTTLTTMAQHLEQGSKTLSPILARGTRTPLTMHKSIGRDILICKLTSL